MKMKIFRCRFCGTRVGWSATSCKVCQRLVSNDRAKAGIVITGVVSLIILAIILYVFLL